MGEAETSRTNIYRKNKVSKNSNTDIDYRRETGDHLQNRIHIKNCRKDSRKESIGR